MKKFINDPGNVVNEMLDGLSAAYPQYVRRLAGLNVIVRAGAPVAGKVALISGGGSGHEPAHAGYVGYGMLDAAVAGDVFTSPTPDQIYEAAKAVNGGAGVLLIVKNYTGDIMNFDIAADMLKGEGVEVASVVVNDDVAVENSLYTAGRRGVAGTVLVHKIAGACAEQRRPLDAVKTTAEKVIANVRSKGVALSPCTVPAAGKPTFTLAEDEMELGIGIHGEPGTVRTKVMPADEVIEDLASSVAGDLGLKAGDSVAVMMNSMGATPLMELFVAYRKAHEILTSKGVSVHRVLTGEYMTSLEMAGLSLTVLRLDDHLRALLDFAADTPAFRQK
ncbi:MAG: dihydroxyacetone kinase subunit DhaK [Ignavibacteriales bacterium]